jgi:hypothetical protein
VARRTSEGKSKPEIVRCLKRFVAREVYQLLASPPPPAAARQQPPAGEAGRGVLPLTG